MMKWLEMSCNGSQQLQMSCESAAKQVWLESSTVAETCGSFQIFKSSVGTDPQLEPLARPPC